ncbi:MAG: UDP-N-acetylmuramoyl-L-alanine--D-glutamate ligase [Oscillospiraceae bacterium]|nr:UDP-N-acetylmuramoyl-L-alanine--D-glutamate ligase [Oscillospiraceae bacterium]
MTINEYLDSIREKKVAVFGIGVSNVPLIKMLLAHGVAVTACDRSTREGLGQIADELEAQGAVLHLGEGYMEDLDADLIFRSPGIRPDVPAFVAAVERGAEVTSEMEVFFEVCPCKKIAVTGSDGKTTTTTIIAKLLEKAGFVVHLGGNIGHPLLAETFDMQPTDVAVLELSSFQLMRMERSPEIAVVTNVSPNHLDIHKGMEEYVASKKNVFLHQGPEDKVVLNRDNELTRSFADEAPGRVTLFSRQNPLSEGVVIEDGVICVKENGVSRPVLPVADILLPGVHNVENYMAAIGAVDGLVPDEVIREFARTFGGVEHRIELVRELDGVRYYNDSIGTSPTRTIAGLRSFAQKVILIAGGYDKHIPYDVLGPELVEHVKAMVLTGATAPKIRAAAEEAEGYDPQNVPIYEIDDFEAAVDKAREIANPGDVVILSPASAAFDKFKNFMVRGTFFKKIVHAFESEGDQVGTV